LVAPLDFQIVIMRVNTAVDRRTKEIEEYENYIASAAETAA
jgi:hypothetical protein